MRLTRRLTLIRLRAVAAKLVTPRAADSAAIGLATLGAVAMAWISTYAYHRLPTTQDDVTDYFMAKTLALGRLWAPIPRFPNFFGQYSMLVYDNHWFGKYPPGWPLVLSLGALANAAWLVNPVVSAGGLVLVYLIGREMYGRKVALLAELLAVSSPFILFIGAGYYAQPVTWLFLGLYVYLLLLWARRSSAEGRRRFTSLRGGGWLLVAAGVAAGIAALARPLDAAAFSLPFLVILIRRPLSMAWLAVGGAFPALFFLYYNRKVTHQFLVNGYTLASSWDRPGFGPSVGPPGGYLGNLTIGISFSNLATDLEAFHLSLFGWPFLVALAIVSVPVILGRAVRWDWLLFSAVGVMVATYMCYWGSAVIQSSFPRYWYLLVPCLSLLAARGFQELYRFPLTPELHFPRSRVAAAGAPAGMLLLLLSFNVFIYMPKLEADVAGWNQSNSAPLDAVNAAHIHNAIVFQVAQLKNWSSYGCVFDQNSPLIGSSDIIWAHHRGIQDLSLMHEFPGRSYYLLNNATLTPLTPSSVGNPVPIIPTGQGTQECGTVVPGPPPFPLAGSASGTNQLHI